MYKYLGSTNIMMYDLLNNISVVLLIIFNFSQLKHKKNFLSKISKNSINRNLARNKKSLFANVTFWAAVETLIVSVLQFSPVMSINTVFGNLVETGTNYFGLCFFSPVILMAGFFFLSVPPLKQLDLITPAFALTLVTIKLACFCAGCCSGIEYPLGLYNHSTDCVEFPVQLVESSLAFLIFIFLMFWRKKAKEGTLFPTYLILYCTTRFFSEFLRSEENVIWILKKYHILCIIGVVLGFIELFIAIKYKNEIIKFYDIGFSHVQNLANKIADKLKLNDIKHKFLPEKNITHHKNRKKKNKKRR